MDERLKVKYFNWRQNASFMASRSLLAVLIWLLLPETRGKILK